MSASLLRAGSRVLLAVLLGPALALADDPPGLPHVPVPATVDAVLPEVSDPLIGTPVPLNTFTPLVVDSPVVVAAAWISFCRSFPAFITCPVLHDLASIRLVPGRAFFTPDGVPGLQMTGYEIAKNTVALSGMELVGPSATAMPVLRRTLVWRKVLQAVIDRQPLDVTAPYPRGAAMGDATELARSIGNAGLDWPALSTALGTSLGATISLSPLRSVSRRFTCPVNPEAILVVGAWQLVERIELLGPGDVPWSDPSYATIPVPPLEHRTGTIHLEVTAFPRPPGSLP